MITVLIIEPSTSGMDLIFACRRLGVKTIVLSANTDDRIISSDTKSHIDYYHEIDTNNEKEVLKFAKKAHETNKIQAVIPGFEFYVCLAAKIAESLSINGTNLAAAELTRDKFKFREWMTLENLPCPKHLRVDNLDELTNISSNIQYPAVIKPTDQAGSLHVSKVNNFRELYTAYEKLTKDTWTEYGYDLSTSVIIESYIEGEEYSVEGVVANHRIHIISITKKRLGQEPFFSEIGHIVGGELESALESRIEQYSKKLLLKLGLRFSAFHLELRVQDNEICAIEVGARMGGDKIPSLIKLVYGIDFSELVISAYLDKPIKIHTKQQEKNKVAAIKYVIAHAPCVIKSLTFSNQKFSSFQVVSQSILTPPESVISTLGDFRSRLAYTIFYAECEKIINSVFENDNQLGLQLEIK